MGSEINLPEGEHKLLVERIEGIISAAQPQFGLCKRKGRGKGKGMGRGMGKGKGKGMGRGGLF